MVLAAPTAAGKSPGEFAPLASKRYFGLNFSWIIAFICAKASPSCDPPTTTSGFAAAMPETIGVMSAVSDGYVWL